MKTKPNPQSAFFRPRLVLAVLLCGLGAFFAAASFAQTQTKAQWPALADQLKEEYLGRQVQAGTALEQLIKDNQDFSILREDEKSDTRRYPAWLRVWWRKAHPELKNSAEDPTGGYPRALNEILEWRI